MDDSQEIKKKRQTLYEEIWAEPMTTVAVRYGLSDNGLRKRCKTLNIPWPPNGYWAKVKAGKPIPDRPSLPSYNETILSYENQGDESSAPNVQAKKKKGVLELLDLEELTVEQLEKMHGFDLLAPGSLEILINWCNGLTVPGRIQDYDELISKHKSEMEYREERDKEYPFRAEGIKFWNPLEKVKERDNEPIIPINVSDSQRNRAYRIVDTLLKAFRELKGSISIDRGDKDNISIILLGTTISFDLCEHKSKRRFLADQKTEFKPLYEMAFDGRLQINWQIYRGRHYHYNYEKESSDSLSYMDTSEMRLENQIQTMIIELYKQCCDNELLNKLNYKKWVLEYEREKEEQQDKELKEEQQKREQKKQAHKNSLIDDIPAHAEKWFRHEHLSRYANELEARLVTYEDEETVRLLKEYIQMVRKNAERSNPLNHILREMRIIELQEDS
jgi:hypothetical protein